MNEYTPDEVSPPGESLKELMEERGLSVADLARLSRLSQTEIERILSGHYRIGLSESSRLSMALNIPASFWRERQRRYDEWRKQKG